MKPTLNQRQSQRTTQRTMPTQAARLLGLNEMQLRTELALRCQDNPILELVEGGLPYAAPTGPTLIEHVTEQLARQPLPKQQRADAQTCASFLNEQGYLPVPAKLKQATGLSQRRITAALQAVRSVDPVGVGAHDLADSMLLQLAASGASDTATRAARKLVRDHFNALARRRYDLVPTQLLTAAQPAFDLLRPRFADDFIPAAIAIEPELEVWRDAGVWRVRLCNSGLPIKLDRELVANIGTNRRLRQLVREAKSMLAVVQFRSATLLIVAQAAVDRQRAFFEGGPAQLQPLRLREVAAATGLAISTISAAIQQKYLAAPQGVVALKYLLQRATNNQHLRCAAALREAIKELISTEDPIHPLSDFRITQLLQTRGSAPARRTITKHRLAAGIPAANLRQRAVQR